MIYIFPISIGTTIIAMLMLIWNNFQNGKFDYAVFKNNKIEKYLKTLWKDFKLNSKISLDKNSKVVIVVIALLMAGTGNNILSTAKLFFYGIAVGYIILMAIYKYKKDITRVHKLREVVILFEAVELYTKAGYTLYQSIKIAKAMTNKIKPALDKCLNSWGRGTKKALEILQKELNIEEANTLILLLLHIESAGKTNLDGLLKHEAINIEHLQNIKTKIKIANRPLLLMAYRMLPLFSILGLIVGGLLYRTYKVMQESGIWNF